MTKINPIQIEIDSFEIINNKKKFQDTIGTQPITATNVLLSSDVKHKKFCFDYEELNKQDD